MCERVETKEAMVGRKRKSPEQSDGGKQPDNDLEQNIKRGGV